MPTLGITVTNKLFITAAYKYVALTMMIAQANLFATKVDLPLDHPIAQTNVILSRCSVAPPRLMEFAGIVVMEKYFFGFGHGHLANFLQWKFHGGAGQDMKQRNEQWSTMTSQIGTNEVRQLALNWLASLGVDTTTMEEKYPCKILQKTFYPNAENSEDSLGQAKRVTLPIFQVEWGSIPLHGRSQYSLPVATMTIFGPTKGLMEYHLFDDSLMLQPKLEIKDAEKLLTISNEVFDKFDEIQRSNLVKEFAP